MQRPGLEMMTMAKNPGQKTHEPGVYRIGKDLFRVRAKWKDPKTGKPKEIDQTVEARSPKAAARIRDELVRTKLAAADVPSAAPIRLGAYATNWLDAKRPELEISTAERYLAALDHHILPQLGDIFVGKLSREDVKRWRNALAEHGNRRTGGGLSAPAINVHLRVLRTVLADAVRDGRITRNVASDVPPLPETKRTEATSNRLRADELERVIAHLRANEPAWYAYFLTASLTGARFGEVSALRWDDVDHEHGLIQIRRAVKKGRDPKTGEWIRRIGSTKTGEEREVAMPPELSAVLRELRRRMVEDQAPGLASGYCFPSPRAGELLWSSVAGKVIRRALKAAEVHRRVTVHGLRRTFTNLVSQSARPEVVRSLTGHSDEEMRQHYTFAEREEKQAAAAGLVASIGLGGGDPGGDSSSENDSAE
jgi:integrase